MTVHHRHSQLKKSWENNVEDKGMNMSSPSTRRKGRSPHRLFIPLLLLCICSAIFYFTVLAPLAKEYSSSNVDTGTTTSKEQMKLGSNYYQEEEDHILQALPVTVDSETAIQVPVSNTPKVEKTSSIGKKQQREIANEQKSQNAKDCQLKMEEYLYSRIYQWVMQQVPIAVNVKVIKNQYHVIFNTGYIDPAIWYNAKYRCNGSNETATIMSATKPGRGNLVIQCPVSIQFNETTLETVTVVPEGGNETFYEMQRFVECEKHDIKDYSPPNTLIGMCTSIAGKGRIREIAHEWVEFHRLIGVDHAWIYINSEWDQGKQPDKPYISWIPYNHNIKSYNFTDRPWTQRSEFFRVTSQVECVLRARRMGVEWVIFTDIDHEYVQINDNETSIHDSGVPIPPLKKLLQTYYKEEKDAIGGLVMNSIPFGNNLSEEKTPEKKLFIDHVYRNKINPTNVKWTRWKQIVNPQNVHNYAIHWLGGDDVLKEIRLDANRVRINHYKEVNKGVGVFQTDKASDLVKDATLAETYHDQLMVALGKISKA